MNFLKRILLAIGNRLGFRSRKLSPKEEVVRPFHPWKRTAADGTVQEFQCYPNRGVLIPIVPGIFSENITKAVQEGHYESHEVALLDSLIQPGEVILEIGAGCGFISAYCAKNPNTKQVFCVEANPNMIDVIKLTHEINGVEATVFNEVLGKVDGETDFYVHPDFWGSGTHNFLGRPIKVKATSFQSRLNQIRPTMLIIDIEGGEESLFEDVDLTGVKKIMVELHQPTIGRRGVKKMFDLLSAQDYHYEVPHSYFSVVTFSHVDRV
jgi:FkbM family methyltransferase